MKRAPAGILTLLTILILIFSFAPQADAGVVRDRTIKKLNYERTSRGLPKLRQNSMLNHTAYHYAIKCRKRGSISHAGVRNRVQPYLNTGHAVYELLGRCFRTKRATPATLIRGFMNSPTHRAAILSSSGYEMGIYVTWRKGWAYVVVYIGLR